MNFLVMQIQGTAASCSGNGTTCADLNTLTPLNGAALAARSETTFRLQLDVRVHAIDDVEIGHMLQTGTGCTIVAIDHRGMEQDRTRDLEADVPPHECLPVAIRKLLAEITATTTGTKAATPPTAPLDVVQHGALRIDLRTREVSVRGKHVRLTRKEFDLLHHLASHPEQVIRREQIMADIWGDGTTRTAPSRAMRTIDTHINSLRSKLGCRTFIETVRGVGFRFIGAAEGNHAPIASSQYNATPFRASA
ncbi:winged helix-turn-helix domain-containing protein [Streptomyces europaeiscabiei]|uniref:winged helix-turn-helix domain-containing protein n=1 Tax=Streptomyces europaeiscabiei TaxID=146819 RepID=UPI002E19037F